MQLSELQERWLTALESGQYKQTHGALCVVGDDAVRSYCCLGVAEHVLGSKEQGPFSMLGRQVIAFCSQNPDGETEERSRCALLSRSVDELQLISSCGHLDSRWRQAFQAELLRRLPGLDPDVVARAGSLAEYNDTLQVPFKILAAVIRSVPEAVFKS